MQPGFAPVVPDVISLFLEKLPLVLEETRQDGKLPRLLQKNLPLCHPAITADALEHVEDVLMSVVGPIFELAKRVQVLSSLDPVLKCFM